MSEFALTKKGIFPAKTVQFSDIGLVHAVPPVLEVHVRFSKTYQQGRCTVLKIVCDLTGPLCPFTAMQEFIRQRGQHQGQLFCHFDKSPLTRYQVQSILQKSLILLGHEGKNFNTHSFRIGSATCAAANSVPEDKLKEMGRWKSNAYQSYIQIPCRDISCQHLNLGQ